MSRLSFAIFAYRGGPLIADYSADVLDLTWSTNEHGFEACSGTIPIDMRAAFRLYDLPVLHVEINDSAGGVWEGRIEESGVTDGGLGFVALGYWAALSDLVYNAAWSDTKLDRWTFLTLEQLSTSGSSDRYQTDKTGRLYIAPRKGEEFDATKSGRWGYERPVGTSRLLTGISFDLVLVGPVEWHISVSCRNAAWTGLANLLSVSGATTGTHTFDVGSSAFVACTNLTFEFYYNAATATYGDETGDVYALIKNVHVRTAPVIRADIIAGHIASTIAGTNTTQLSNSTARIQATGLELRDEMYEDTFGIDILPRLARLGDGTTPWEIGVWDRQLVHLWPRGTGAQTWYVDLASIDVSRDLRTLWNRAIPTYQDALRRTVRGTTQTDSLSIARNGITRIAPVRTTTTDSALATSHALAYLNDHADITPVAGIRVDAIWDGAGARGRLWRVRSGDTIVIRNLPPTLSPAIDRLRSFRIATTTYHAEGWLEVEPEAPLNTLEYLSLQESEPRWRRPGRPRGAIKD